MLGQVDGKASFPHFEGANPRHTMGVLNVPQDRE